jgi:hypothetical protein
VKSQMVTQVDKSKVAVICLLFVTAGLITLSGVAFILYSAANNVTFAVMQADIPGTLFGAVIAFLGVRYILSVRKLRLKLYASHTQFSWSNFKAH